MAVNRVSLGFAQLPDSELSGFSTTVVTKMTNNPSYPTPRVEPGDITTANTTFAAAIVAAAQGGTQLTAAKNAAREVLVALLRTQAAYVQSIAMDDLTVLLSSGFWNISTDRARKPLPKPTVLDIDNFASTQLMVKLAAIANARSYEVRVRVGTQDWRNAGVFTKARGMLLEGLLPGQMYEIQVRAVGGSTGYSDWSDPIMHMAI
ncbi:MAG: fibronectin type III domain-containing protein [Verrucomicrobiota bacterium]